MYDREIGYLITALREYRINLITMVDYVKILEQDTPRNIAIRPLVVRHIRQTFR